MLDSAAQLVEMTLKQRQFLVFSAVLAGCKWKFSRHHVKDIVPMSGVQRNFNFRFARSIIVSLTTSALNFFFPCHFTTFHPISTVPDGKTTSIKPHKATSFRRNTP